MSELKYPHLFEPIVLGGTLFRNRIFAAPTSIHEITTSRKATEAMDVYYERKAIGGAASVSVGELIVDSEHGMGGVHHLQLDNPANAGSLYGISNAITRHGAVACAELQHAGMFASFSGSQGHTVYGPVAKTIIRDAAVGVGEKSEVVAMDEEAIEQTIEAFANAAAYAKFCGFGMVLIHGGHGWLVSQFLSPKINTRTDRWGGSLENRMRFALAICDRIRQKCGPNFPIEFRMSGDETCEKGYDFEEGKKIAMALDGHVDLIHVSTGNHEDHDAFVETHPDMFHEHACNVHYAREIKKLVKTPVATVGALNDPAALEEIIASGAADVVECARALIADPDMPNKARAGRDEDIRYCMRCFNCFSHLVVNGRICCAINPEIGRENEAREGLLPHECKKILIAGGGIGGMEAAIEAAKAGHQVILCEKKSELGGALRCERDVPFKVNLDKYLNLQARLCQENPAIDVRLNTEVTPDYARAQNADVIIASTGARPMIPKFLKGWDLPHVHGAEEVYTNTDLAGKKTVILGGGLVGLELGIFLAGKGVEVSIVEMMDHMGTAGNVLHEIGIDVQLRKNNIALSLSTKAMEITETGVRVQDLKTGEERVIEVETVIYAMGQIPQREAAIALYDCAPMFYVLGDCTTPKNIRQATDMAYHIVRDIGVIR